MAHTLQGLAFTIDLYAALCIFTDTTLPQMVFKRQTVVFNHLK